MANTLLTIDMITKEALRILHEQLVFTNKINKQYDPEFQKKGAQIGSVLRIRKPAQFKTRSGTTYAAQDLVEQQTTLAITEQLGIDVTFTDDDLALELNDFSKQFLQPAMAQLATSVEAKTLEMILKVSNSVYNASGITFKNLNQGRASLTKSLAPKGGWCGILDPEMTVDLIDELKGLFQDSTQISKQYREGMLGRTAQFDYYESNILPTNTIPSDITGTVTVAEGASTATFAALAASTTYPAGFRWTVAGLNKCHPETKKAYKDLYEFVAREDFTTDGAGAGTASIYPIFASGTDARQNAVGTLPSSAAFSVNGSADDVLRSGILFQKDAFTMATADLVVPKGTDMASRMVYDGISMRFVRDFDIQDGNMLSRFDIVFGFENLREQFACLLQEPDV